MTEPLGRWTTPPLGREAEADLPDWLVAAWTVGKLGFNGFGGFTINEPEVVIGYPGDTLEFTHDGTIRLYATDAVKP